MPRDRARAADLWRCRLPRFSHLSLRPARPPWLLRYLLSLAGASEQQSWRDIQEAIAVFSL
eukprot:6201647-Pleurochrysis_carterae.AAC.2